MFVGSSTSLKNSLLITGVTLSVVVVGSICVWCWCRCHRKRLKEVKTAGERREQEQKEKEQGENDEKRNYTMLVPVSVDNSGYSGIL